MNSSDTAQIIQSEALVETVQPRLDTVVSEARLHRAAALKKASFIALLVSIFAYPFVTILLIALPHDFATNWAYSSLGDLRLYSAFMAVLSTSMIGGAYETEFRQRALNNPDIGTSRAIIESSLRLVAWIVASLCSLIVVGLFTDMIEALLGL